MGRRFAGHAGIEVVALPVALRKVAMSRRRGVSSMPLAELGQAATEFGLLTPAAPLRPPRRHLPGKQTDGVEHLLVRDLAAVVHVQDEAGQAHALAELLKAVDHRLG